MTESTSHQAEHGTEHAPALHGVVDQSVSIDRARLLIERVPVALLGGATAAVGTAFVLQADMPAIGLWSWVAAVVVVHLVRLVLSRKASAPGVLEAAPLRWLTWMRMSVFAAGAVWAAIPLWLYPTGTNEQWFIALVLSAVAGAGTSALAVDATSAMVFILPVGVPTIARLLLSGNPPLHMAGMLAAVYLVYLLFAAWQMQKLFRDLTVLRTRATHQVLVDHLTGLPTRSAPATSWPWAISTWMTSNRSMTATAMRPEMRCCRSWPAAGARNSARQNVSPAWEATSSSS